MLNNKGKQKSFLLRFTWIVILLLAMGAIFLTIAVVMQLVSINPESLNVRVNGVRQPPTEETLRIFRLTFLFAFGVVGLGLAIAGGIVAGSAWARRRLNRRLKEEGVRLTAQAVDYSIAPVHVNHRNLTRLLCSYEGSDGRTYIFKSGFLRMDPTPYLQQGQVYVYRDRDNISRYYVDIDGSVGLGARIVEL